MSTSRCIMCYIIHVLPCPRLWRGRPLHDLELLSPVCVTKRVADLCVYVCNHAVHNVHCSVACVPRHGDNQTYFLIWNLVQ